MPAAASSSNAGVLMCGYPEVETCVFRSSQTMNKTFGLCAAATDGISDVPITAQSGVIAKIDREGRFI